MRALIRQIKKTYGMAEPHERKIVLHNFAVLSVLQAITYVLPILIIPYLFRVLGPAKFGLISFAQAFVQYFMILTDYGFSISATKEISLCQDDHSEITKVFSSVMMVKLALAWVSFLLLAATLYFVPRFRADWAVYALSFGMVVGNTIFPVWFFQGTEKMKHISDLNILGGGLGAILTFFMVKRPEDYLMVPLIMSAVTLISGLLGQYLVFKKFGISFHFPGYENVKRQLKAGWDIFISNVAINAYTTTRIFAIGLLTNNTITGYYSIAEKMAGICQTFPLSSFSQALFPRLSKIYQKSRHRAFEFMEKIQHITIYISLICLPTIFIFARPLVKLICGDDYPEAVISFRLLLISVLFISSNAFRVQFLLVCGKTHIYSRIHVMMAMIGLPLIFMLISAFSFTGAAIATIILEAMVFTITYITVQKLRFR